MENTKNIDFSNVHFYIGIDVHKNTWKVAIYMNNFCLKPFTMPPEPEKLHKYMQKNYPNGIYHSVYEAGFCGFSIHEELLKLNFDNIVVSAADVPTTNKEKSQKSDSIDCNKLARELSKGNLTSIYIPDKFHQEFRSLIRRRDDLSYRISNIKKKIKSCLMFMGVKTPDEYKYWSGAYIKWLRTIKLSTDFGNENLSLLIAELLVTKDLMSRTIKTIRKGVKQNKEIDRIIHLLLCVPGIGFITAITLYSEIIDITRFSKNDNLASYVGLIPSISESGDVQKVRGLTNRYNHYLRNMLIESAWTAARVDPALSQAYNKLNKRMSATNAIIRIAKKLINRIRYVWINNQEYSLSVVK